LQVFIAQRLEQDTVRRDYLHNRDSWRVSEFQFRAGVDFPDQEINPRSPEKFFGFTAVDTGVPAP